jgi:sigma-B regulation protein RsbU (phosphoserine phosphatase)
MQNSVGRMNALVSDLTDFARSRMGGGLRLQLKTVRLEPVITHAVNEIAAANPVNKIELHLDFPYLVECDPMRIAQLVSNLVANAVSHGELGGTIEVKGFIAGSILEISVSNKGAAIPSEILDRIFAPFTRNEVQKAQLGLGLGLYISSEIARSHNGELKVHSTSANTKFTFRMPMMAR